MFMKASRPSGLIRSCGSLRLFQSSRIWLRGTTPASCVDVGRRFNATQAEPPSDKPYYVTTPIYYVNAAPHVGHLYSMVLADILKRWQVLKKRKAILCTGTDEHGMKVQRAAMKAGMEPQLFCDEASEIFKRLAAHAKIDNDHFIRTTEAEHKDTVQYAWTVLQERGYIYSSKHEGWYSVSDETFYPQSGVHLIVDPPTGRKIMASIETGKEVEWSSEINYKFRLSGFQDQLLRFYEDNPYFVVPQTRMDEIVQSVSAGLEDLSVSRPTQRLSWGVPVPGDETQTIYVWLDALLNYITKAGYPWSPGKEFSGGWPADCQVIGKEITRFHCIYWPAFLMALEIPPPKQFLTHAHWTLGRQKMAKSTGNVVDPFLAVNRFGADIIRFYLAHEGGISSDADYSNEYIIRTYKKVLQGGLGNLTSRIVRGKGWSVREAVQAAAAGDFHPWPSQAGELADKVTAVIAKLEETPVVFDQRMTALDIPRAVREISSLVQFTNHFLAIVEPWTIAANKGSADKGLRQIIYLAAESLRLTGILLQPVMPGDAARLLDMLGVDESRRTFADARFEADADYGESRVPLGKGLVGTLFPPLSSDA